MKEQTELWTDIVSTACQYKQILLNAPHNPLLPHFSQCYELELECCLVSHSGPVAETLRQLIGVDWPPLSFSRVDWVPVENGKGGWVVGCYLKRFCCCLSFCFCIPLPIKPQAGALQKVFLTSSSRSSCRIFSVRALFICSLSQKHTDFFYLAPYFSGFQLFSVPFLYPQFPVWHYYNAK